MNLISEIERQLAERFSKKCCVLTGSGTTAIYVLLKSLHFKKNITVLLPGICCFAPAYAVKYAGLKLDFCDVSLTDGCLTAKSIDAAIKKNSKIKVVIGVHLYGNVMEVESIKKICKKRNVLFVEDVCQAYGSEYKGRPCGSFGDFSILSFGHTKILDAGGLGALLTDNEEVVCLARDRVEKIGARDSERLKELSARHCHRYYTLQKKARLDPEKKVKFGELWRGYRDAFICGIDKRMLKNIKILLKQEKRIINHRQKLYLVYKGILQDQKKISIVKSRYKGCPWRFSCLIEDVDIIELCDVLRSHGYDISNWYPNLANMFVADYSRRLRNSDEFEKRISNMWLDETKNKKYVVRLCELLKKIV